MSQNVTWNGVSYTIPDAGDVNWGALTNFLVALGNNAGVAKQSKLASRVATATPVTLSATADYGVFSNLTVPGAVAVTLPAGIDGQVFVIGDGKPDAVTNNITITPNGAETIKGAATLVLNHNGQMAMIQFNAATADWKVLANVIYPGTLNLAADVTGTLPVANGGTGVTASTGTVAVVLSTSPTLVTPLLGTPTSGNLANCTGLPIDGGTSGTLPIGRGGTGQTTKAPAFDALSPANVTGDISYYSGSNNVRLGIGSTGQGLIVAGGIPSWGAITPTLDSPLDMINLGIGTSVSANALTISLFDKAGSAPSAGSPVKIAFRSATATSGLYVERSATAATTLVVSSGSTLGAASAVATNYWVYAIDNAGTIELGVSQVLFPEGIYTSVAEGGAGAADSNNVIYSTTARTSVAMRPIAKFTATEATAGTWATAPSAVSIATDSVLSAGDPILATYTSTSTSNITTSTQFMDFATKVIDTKNAVLGAGSGLNATYTNTWRFVCPRAGRYRVTHTLVATSAVAAGGVIINSNVCKAGGAISGVPLTTGVQYGATATLVVATNPGFIFDCAINDVISVDLSNNTTPTNWPLVASGRTNVSIEWISA